MNRYILGVFIAIGLVILIVILFTGGSKPSTKANQPVPLTSYANTDVQVQMTVDGPTVAPQNHNSVQITVGQSEATYTLFQGYDGQVVRVVPFSNTVNSYSAFLAALNQAGFNRGNNNPNLANDAGYCATGSTYVFEIIQNGKDLQRFWATNCLGEPRTFLGNIYRTSNLFQAQIPNFNQVNTSGLYF
jgi:hypothetical protein